MKCRLALPLLLLCVTTILASDVHVRFTRSRCGIPVNEYNVNTTKGIVADEAVYVSFKEEVVKQYLQSNGNGRVLVNVNCKRFDASQARLSTQYVQVQGLQIALYETGQAVVSGNVLCNGGIHGELKGNRVRVILKYTGGYRTVKEPSATDTTPKLAIQPGPVFHEETLDRFVRKNEPTSLQFNIEYVPAVRQHFYEIERVEIQLQVLNDR